MSTTRFPLDFDSLQKGDVVTKSQIEHIYGISYESSPDRYRLRALALKSQIERELFIRGEVVTTSMRGPNIHILTDAQAAEYNKSQFTSYQYRLRSTYVRNYAVDVAMLDDEMKKDHIRTVEVQGKICASMNSAGSRIMATPYLRKVPGIQGA